ncbi:Uncharacterised protein [Clostridioides difficile]|uniref:rolling circle replication-associated protein n=1 Tax=Clostridioides difficile TaxID=1496 RepID=UPI001026059D|nr:hypothetical protein [Clostridioides difficile]VFC58634.1 Uncharacterised protein [Clostridioides difficile]
MGKSNDDIVVIPPEDVVKVTRMNHIVEVQHMVRMNRKNNIKKLDKDRYVEISTGEIKEFQHSENRKQNYNSLRQTFKKLRYLINANFVGQANELHITLTYRTHVIDAKQLYQDFDKFMKRLRYKYKDKSSIDYLSVVEPQGSGRWHCHVLIRFNDLESIYIPNRFDKSTKKPVDAPLYDLWGNGWVTIKSLKDVDNIGAYLSAYLADVELTEETVLNAISEKREIVTKVVEGQEKKFVKGGRLHMYPSGMNLYRKSKGIIVPERQEIKFKDIKKVVGSAKPHYEKSYHIEDGDFENTISFQQYNTKRT